MNAANIQATLDSHGVRSHVDQAGRVWAFEEATVKGHDGVVRDASDWIPAPTTVHALAAWLGY